MTGSTPGTDNFRKLKKHSGLFTGHKIGARLLDVWVMQILNNMNIALPIFLKTV